MTTQIFGLNKAEFPTAEHEQEVTFICDEELASDHVSILHLHTPTDESAHTALSSLVLPAQWKSAMLAGVTESYSQGKVLGSQSHCVHLGLFPAT